MMEDAVRAYDAFVDAMDLSELGMVVDENQVGPPEYDPVSMLKLLVYGYSYGIRSSRKLERAVHHNLSFIWLVGGIRPDHKTISSFRRKYRKALSRVLGQCARMCLRLGLVEGNILFVDGTKIRANASLAQTWDSKRCEQMLGQIDRRVEQLLEEIESVDQQEEGQESWVRMKEELTDQQAWRRKVEEIARSLKRRKNPKGGTASLNVVDPDSRRIKKSRKTLQGYNGQMVCDEKHGLIVSTDVVNASNDTQQFSTQIQQAEANLAQPCSTAVADAGYYNTQTLQQVARKGTQVIVPTPKAGNAWGTSEAFEKSVFRYDSEQDCYRCPQGHRLRWIKHDHRRGGQVYTIEKAEYCRVCPHWGVCTKSKVGRSIVRLEQEELRDTLRKQFEQPEAKKVFARRKAVAEHPFGHLKRNLGLRFFLLRGFLGVKAEFALGATAFNLTRMLSLLGGTTAFLTALRSG
jgi:transposase